MDMSRYIFLDNWVLSLLRDRKTKARLTAFVKSYDFTVLLTSLSMVELYNPGWQRAETEDRGAAAARFLANVPCVIVDPQRVWEKEVAAHLTQLQALPLQLDLSDFSVNVREEILLRILRRDEFFLKMGIDIQAWSLDYEEIKKSWPSDVANIIDKACGRGHLKRDKAGRFTELEETKEVFLFSLDFRHADGYDVDTILVDVLRRMQAGRQRITAVRLGSLCFWYSYVDIDMANRPKLRGSDIGDIYHISLMPYCSAFTTDGTMHRTLQRVRDRGVPMNCPVWTKHLLEEQLRRHA